MTKFRTALLALTFAFTVVGGAGAAGHVDAKGPGKSSITKITKSTNVTSMKNGDSWCC